jgi:hypothetical protein
MDLDVQDYADLTRPTGRAGFPPVCRLVERDCRSSRVPVPVPRLPPVVVGPVAGVVRDNGHRLGLCSVYRRRDYSRLARARCRSASSPLPGEVVHRTKSTVSMKHRERRRGNWVPGIRWRGLNTFAEAFVGVLLAQDAGRVGVGNCSSPALAMRRRCHKTYGMHSVRFMTT